MEALFRLLQKYATGKIISGLFVLTMSVYISMLVYSIPAVSAYSPGMALFDLSPSGYSYTYANDLLSSLGEEGRHLYLSVQLPLDFIYPGLFSITYSLLLVWIIGKTQAENSKIRYFALVPFMAGVFDYLENIFIIKMISSFPDLQVSSVKIASAFTLLKSSFTMAFFVLLIAGFAVLLKQKLSASD
ncbi:hypothetical protein ACVFI8_19265 [Agarivorans sp. MS3-6]